MEEVWGVNPREVHYSSRFSLLCLPQRGASATSQLPSMGGLDWRFGGLTASFYLANEEELGFTN